MNIIRNFKDPSSTLMSTKCPLHDLGGPKLTLSKEDFSSSSFSFLAAYFCLGFVSSMKVLTNWNSSTWKKMLYFCHSVLRILVNYRFEKKKHNYLQLLLYSLSHILSFSSTCWRWRASAWMVALKARRERGQAVCSWRGGPGSRRLNVLKFNFNF